ncbi:MAG: sodium:solute symporter family transporter, partial [Planctomycetota bacterium]
MTALIIIIVYLGLLLGLGLFSNRFFKGTSSDYFLASRGIGSFLLLMSLFGTTMTAFALVGSSGAAFKSGIGVYGKMASWAGIIHSACFFLVGIKLWSWGKKYGYVTQIQFFRDRFESNALGLVLFPVLVGLVIPYLLIGVLSAGTVVKGVTLGAFPEMFAATKGGIPFWIGSGIICLVVLMYVFF